MHRLWRDVSGIEYVEERPRVRVAPTNIDFASISWVQPFDHVHSVCVGFERGYTRYKQPVTRTVEVVNVGKVRRSADQKQNSVQ